MSVDLVPVTVVIPTANRTEALRRTLVSLAAQSEQPAELVIVDASDDASTRALCREVRAVGLDSAVSWQAAEVVEQPTNAAKVFEPVPSR